VIRVDLHCHSSASAVAGLAVQGGIACALAHPFYNVAAPLTPRHRRRALRHLGGPQRRARRRAQPAGRLAAGWHAALAAHAATAERMTA
jgi:hypothetical protein